MLLSPYTKIQKYSENKFERLILARKPKNQDFFEKNII